MNWNFEQLRRLTEHLPTPFYLYDLDGIYNQARRYEAAISRRLKGQVHFAMKANSHVKVLQTLRRAGCGLDVVSGGELVRGLETGFEGRDIVFSGVGKTKAEIEMAVRGQVKSINVESLPEIERIVEIGQALKARGIPLMLRLNPDVDAKTHPHITTGLKENKFGLEISQVEEALSLVRASQGVVSLVGLAMHIGSQLLDMDCLTEGAEILCAKYQSLQSVFPTLRYIDFGGGLGISYKGEVAPDVEDYAEVLAQVMEKKFQGVKGPVPEIVIEPGRSLVGPFGLLVTEVQYVKRTQHKTFVIVDTGMHHLLRPSLYSAYHRIVHFRGGVGENGMSVPEKLRAEVERVDVVGPICESADVLGRDRELEHSAEGDRLAILDVGAYGAVMASEYNLRGPVHEYAVQGGKLVV